MGGKTSAKSKNAWNAKAYDRVSLILKKDESPTKDEVQAAAEEVGESVNSYIVGAIKKRMEEQRSPQT